MKREFRALAACDIESPPAIFLDASPRCSGGKKSTVSYRDIPNTGGTIGMKFLGVKDISEVYVGAAYPP
jgi:hypothetical protein